MSVPAALGVLHRLQVPQSVPCGKEVTLKRLFRCVVVGDLSSGNMCSIAVLRGDLISSSLSMRSWCRCLRIIHLLAQCLVLTQSQSASTALCRQFINGDKSPRQLSISSVVSLRAFETFTWSRATCRSSVTGRAPSQTVRTLSFVSFAFAVVCALMRSLFMSCITRSKVRPEPGV